MILRKLCITLSVVSIALMPVATHATVVSADDIARLQAHAVSLNDGCKLLDFALYVQGGGMNAKPEWKTLVSSGITISFPWAPYWYLVGKQIPWYETMTGESNTFHLGRYQPGDGCSISREYRVQVFPGTIKNKFTPPGEGEAFGTVMETMNVNGKQTALVEMTPFICEEQAVAVEVTKNNVTSTVLITHVCGDMNAEMMRMAARIK